MLPSARPVSLLLVDDKPENLLALQALLSRPDYNLVSAASGPEALSLFEREEFALILLDVQMPGMDGFETARRIRATETGRRTPIIFVTAIHRELSYVEQGYDEGAVDYILKPLNPDIIRSKVSVFVDLYRHRLEVIDQARQLIHEREQRSKLESAQKHYRDLVDRLDHSIVWEAEASTLRFLFVSKRATQLLGHPLEQWFTEDNFLFNHVPEQDRDKLKSILRKSLELGTDERCEHRLVARDGQEYWFHTGVQFEHGQNEKPDHFRGLSVDITPLKREEARLRNREQKLRQVVDSSMLGHVFSNLEGTIHDANECFLRMVEYTREDLTAGRIALDALTPPEYVELDRRAIEQLKASGVCDPYEKELIRKDGSRFPIMAGAALLEGSDDELVAFVLDLTERKHALDERTRELTAREELLEIVSHDLKNPLSAILMNAALMFRRLPDNPDTASARRQLDMIQRSADRMKRLIEDLLDLAKVEAGRLHLELSPLPIQSVVNDAIEILQSLAEEKQLRIQKEVQCGSSCVVSCDRDRLLQVFSNLLGNAVKFTPPGGAINVRAEEQGNEVQFAISDTGPGIDREHLPHIFDRFWQSRSSRKIGSGLGLSIAKGIVEAHGGRIWAKSDEGAGSTFQFTLPKTLG